jgi:hypothetical protein
MSTRSDVKIPKDSRRRRSTTLPERHQSHPLSQIHLLLWGLCVLLIYVKWIAFTLKLHVFSS